MPGRLLFVSVLHSHQPVGNFEKVFGLVFEQSYARFVEVFEEFPEIPWSLHFSGCLLEWLAARRPEYIARLKAHVQGREGPAWEMIGGGMYEPIFTMLPTRDRREQIRRMQDYLHGLFGVRPRGLWLPERVWEPALVKDLADAGVEYLTLDDNHFRAAGLRDEELTGGFTTEDQGATLRVYPASERLRYLIPYGLIEHVLEYLKSFVPEKGERLLCYADDGEKFGSWPKTYEHVYTNGWLKAFLTALRQAQVEGWLECLTLSAAHDRVAPAGKVYIPENSYREMTEWVLPAQALSDYEHAVAQVRDDPRVKPILPLVKGGNWRNFKVKYPEAGHLYAKMMELSASVARLPARGSKAELARRHLLRGQCNCAYWHGVFGGLYLPHLRHGVYRELVAGDVAAKTILKELTETAEADFDFDGARELKLANPHLALYLHPARGGHLYELDLRAHALNVLDTLSRRPEAYHEKLARAVSASEAAGVQSIHDMVIAKEKDLDKLLQYDAYLRESLVDHLCARRPTPDDFLSGDPPSDPGFRQGRYEARVEAARAARGRAAAPRPVVLTRRAEWNGAVVEVSKRVALGAGPAFEVAYRVALHEGAARDAWFAVEFNCNLRAGDAEDRYYCLDDETPAGRLVQIADWGPHRRVGLRDGHLGLALDLSCSTPAEVLVSPVRTVSQSESGFESVYQSSSVALAWPVRLEAGRPWEVGLVQEARRARG